MIGCWRAPHLIGFMLLVGHVGGAYCPFVKEASATGSDIAAISDDSTNVAQITYSPGTTTTNWATAVGENHDVSYLSGDFDGDGFADIGCICFDDTDDPYTIITNNKGTSQVSWTQALRANDQYSFYFLPGDFNGDGEEDIAALAPHYSGSSPSTDVVAKITYGPDGLTQTSGATDWSLDGERRSAFVSGDFFGEDGITDLLAISGTGSNFSANLYSGPSGTALTPWSFSTGVTSPTPVGFRAGDINGDNVSDLIAFFYSTATTSYSATIALGPDGATQLSWGLGNAPYVEFLVGDYDFDGYDDIAGVIKTGGHRASLFRGSETVSAPTAQLWTLNLSNNLVTAYRSGDYNGDGVFTTFSGSVTLPSGEGVAGAVITFTRTSPSTLVYSVTTGADGSYSIDLRAGEYIVVVTLGNELIYNDSVTADTTQIYNILAGFVSADELYFFWNNFLRIQNQLVVFNRTDNITNGSFTLYDTDGSLVSQDGFPITFDGKNEYGFQLNQLFSFAADSYGFGKLNTDNGALDGHIAYYRFNESQTRAEFEATVPFTNTVTGLTAVPYDAIQAPSTTRSKYNMSQILSLANPGSTARSFTINFYAQDGALFRSEALPLPALSRRDLDVGDYTDVPTRYGLIEILPPDSEPYLAQLLRVVGKTPKGSAPQVYNFALGVTADQPKRYTQWVPVTAYYKGESMITLANPSDAAAAVPLVLYRHGTRVPKSLGTFTVEPHTVKQVSLKRWLKKNQMGTVKINTTGTTESTGILAYATTYHRSNGSSSLLAVDMIPARAVLGGTSLYSTYDTSPGYSNSVRLFNPTTTDSGATVTTYDGGERLGSHSYTLKPKQSVSVPLNRRVGVRQNSVGMVEVETDQAGGVQAEMFRRQYLLKRDKVKHSSPLPMR